MNVDIWWRWWAFAAIAHVLGAPTGDGWSGRGLANVVVGWVAIAVVARPDLRVGRVALAAAIVVSAFVEAPLLGNHWWLAAVVSLAALAARPWTDDDGFAGRFAPTARVLLLVFYSFAAVAKLNTGFLDPVESCARFFANQALDFWRLPLIPGDGAMAPVLPYPVLLIELAVPVLLVVPRTRRFGVWLAIAFHLVLTLDLRQHFYDFTLVLVPLFSLFAPPSLLASIDRSLPRLDLGRGRPWMALVAIQVAAFHLPVFGPAESGARTVAIRVAWVMWLVLLVSIALGMVLAWRSGADRSVRAAGDHDVDATDPSPHPVRLRPAGVAGVALVLLALFNGLAPYLEVKTATGFNMYANLVTADGETNHLVIRRTAGLRDAQGATVEIIEADDDGLAAYASSGFALPVANLRDYLADHPGVSVTYRLGGEVVRHRPDAPGPLTPEPLGWFEERLVLFRAVPLADPPACQNVWLPAR
ncbi:MAG: hypothetical protein AAGA93_01940 [Actinomycetota bacterium]